MKKAFLIVIFCLFASTAYSQVTLDACSASGVSVQQECNIMLVADSYSGGYIDGNNRSTKLLGCNIYRALDIVNEYAGGIVRWSYDNSSLDTGMGLDAWEYPASSGNWRYQDWWGNLEDSYYSGADYVLYALGKNDTGMMMNCYVDAATDRGYANPWLLSLDHQRFIQDVLIGTYGYSEDQIIVLWTSPLDLDLAGNYEEDNDTQGDCRSFDNATLNTDDNCVLAHEYGSAETVGYQCLYTNRHLRIVGETLEAALLAYTTTDEVIFASHWDWVLDGGYTEAPVNGTSWDQYFDYYDGGDGLHPDFTKTTYQYWKDLVAVIEAEVAGSPLTPSMPPPAQVTTPNPGNATTEQDVDVDISWAASNYASKYGVYFGEDSTPDATEFVDNRTSLTYDPGLLDGATQYWWRIDAINDNSTVTGLVWNFTTESASATVNYYVDNSAPDGNGSVNNPWDNFADINWALIQNTINAGNNVNLNLKKGETWNEQMYLCKLSGTATEQITIRPDPLTSGADPKINGIGSTDASGSCASFSDHSFIGYEAEYITLDGIDLEGEIRIGMGSPSGKREGNIVRNCTIHESIQTNLYVSKQEGMIIENNIIWGSQNSHGIYIDGIGIGIDNTIVQYNDIYDNDNHQLQINGNGDYSPLNTIIRYNRFHGNPSGGNAGGNAISMVSGENTMIYGNLLYELEAQSGIAMSWDNNDDPPGLYPCTDSKIYNNTIVMDDSGFDAGLRVMHRSTGNIAKNNIIVDATGNSSRPLIQIDDEGSLTGTITLDKNIYWRTSGNFNNFVLDEGDYYDTLSAWQGTGHDPNSYDTDPDFDGSNYWITSGSGTSDAIGNAVDVGTDYYDRLDQSSSWPDNVSIVSDNSTIGAYEYIVP